MDASGNAPGSYVVTTGNVKHQLTATSNEITITKNIAIQAGASNTVVIDFDLRKMIIHQSGNTTDQFDFVTTTELQNSVRVVVENKTGVIAGNVTNISTSADKIVVYAYKKGTFNSTTETQAQGSSGIEFKNAVSSATVSGAGHYELHFLEAGSYELHFAGYKYNSITGKSELQGSVSVTGSGALDLLNLSVVANATLTANAVVAGG
jgi:hypothetical protein